MKKRIWLFAGLFITYVSLQGQNAEQNKIRTVRKTATTEKKYEIAIIEQNEDFVFPGQQEEFYYIKDGFFPQESSWIASLEGFCSNTRKSNLSHLFFDFKESANKLGGNSFFFEEIYSGTDTVSVRIAVFYLTEEELDDNLALYPENEIYIFGDWTNSKAKWKTVKINGKKIKIDPFKYYVHHNSVGQKAVVSIGGLAGSKYILTGKEGQLPVYITLGGFEMAPVEGMNSMGVSFRTGSIHPLTMNLGQFLSVVLQETSE
jgi:hypothetical protein